MELFLTILCGVLTVLCAFLLAWGLSLSGRVESLKSTIEYKDATIDHFQGESAANAALLDTVRALLTPPSEDE